MATGDPLSEERLAEIRAMIPGFQYGTLTITSVTPDEAVEAYNAHHGARWAIQDLLAEVDRMRETLNRVSVAYMREVQRNRPDAPGRE